MDSTSKLETSALPSLFLFHGSPMLAIQKNTYTNYLNLLGESLKPKALVIFSAHWECSALTISFTDGVYETIYDFRGFPDELYELKYPAKGSTKTAALVKERLEKNGINTKLDTERGLDHGSWVLLSHFYPKADVPVVQVSVNSNLSAKDQINIGKALKGLNEEGVLIIGSGVSVHNLRLARQNYANPPSTPDKWAVEFDDWMVEKLKKRDLEALYDWRKQAPNAKMAVPTAEHFAPLLIAFGSGDEKAEPKEIYRGYEFGNVSFLSMQF